LYHRRSFDTHDGLHYSVDAETKKKQISEISRVKNSGREFQTAKNKVQLPLEASHWFRRQPHQEVVQNLGPGIAYDHAIATK
jgi:hypothetical protein